MKIWVAIAGMGFMAGFGVAQIDVPRIDRFTQVGRQRTSSQIQGFEVWKDKKTNVEFICAIGFVGEQGGNLDPISCFQELKP